MDVKEDFTALLLQHWDDFVATCFLKNRDSVNINGKELTIAKVVAVSRYLVQVEITPESLALLKASCDVIKTGLDRGLVIYGVNTGFGGSADARPKDVLELQNMLIRMLNFGILSVTGKTYWHTDSTIEESSLPADVKLEFVSPIPLEDPLSSTSMPESWSRASMTVRLNSLISGASGVKPRTVEMLAWLINRNLAPVIPLRGSISASGDLSPLSYIAAAMQGRSTAKVWTDDKKDVRRRVPQQADVALYEAGLKRIILGPKEGLAIVNGTSVSAGVAALALHEAHCQAALSQVLTAMSVEALRGTDESFHPFIAQVRPHPGQMDAAKNIFAFLHRSGFVKRHDFVRGRDGRETMVLRQDRYSVRTASQWIGPVLEDLVLAHKQITVELNSVTDNPLIDTETRSILHGGNFQAKSVSSAMEKTRAGIQSIGKVLFTQCTEIINPATNRGLPPNLAIENPSESASFKGVDVMIAALASELGFLASPVAPHVQHAEMGNQALNSLALVSARYTLTACDVLTQLSSAHLLALCQALDLRAFQHLYFDTFKAQFMSHVANAYAYLASEGGAKPHKGAPAVVGDMLWEIFRERFELTMTMDVNPRIYEAVEALQSTLLENCPDCVATVSALREFNKACAADAIKTYHFQMKEYRTNPGVAHLAGSATKRMYTYVRKDLGIPFFGNEELSRARMSTATDPYFGIPEPLNQKPDSVGGYITKIYEAMKSGALYNEVVKCFKEVSKIEELHIPQAIQDAEH